MWRVGPSVRPRAGGCAQTWATERARGGTVHAADPECAKCELLVEHRRNKTSRGEAPCRSRCCMCCLDGVTLHPSIPPSQGWDAIAAFTVSGTRGGGGGSRLWRVRRRWRRGGSTRCDQVWPQRVRVRGRWWRGGAVRAAIECGNDARVCAADGGGAAVRAAIKCGRNAHVCAADGGRAAGRQGGRARCDQVRPQRSRVPGRWQHGGIARCDQVRPQHSRVCGRWRRGGGARCDQVRPQRSRVRGRFYRFYKYAPGGPRGVS
jgi:hypothetical protein